MSKNTNPTEPLVTAAFYEPGRFRPEQSVGYLMRQLLSSILNQVDARLSQHDLTYAQWLPLYKLAMGESCTVAGLSRHLGSDPGAMTRSLDRLEAKSLVRRERSAADRRVVNIALTDAGRDVARHVPPVLAEVLNQHLAGFSHEEWQTLLNLLQRMLANSEALRHGLELPVSGCPLQAEEAQASTLTPSSSESSPGACA
jgi:DNA-binding MarR family transcriptional regulator